MSKPRVFSKEAVTNGLYYVQGTMARSLALSKIASAFGFDFHSTIHARERLMDESYECLTAGTVEGIAEEIGDVMFMAINIARLIDREPALLLEEANRKFAARMEKAENFLIEIGRDPTKLSETEWRIVWKAAKRWADDDEEAEGRNLVRSCIEAGDWGRRALMEPENSNPDAIWDPNAKQWVYPGSSDLRDAPTDWKGK